MSPTKQKFIKWQKLGGHRWRLECEERRIVIAKNEDGTVSLEDMCGTSLGVYADWATAKGAAAHLLE